MAYNPALYFVTGTDTDAGKSVVSLLLMLTLHKHNRAACYCKPVQTGCSPALDAIKEQAAPFFQTTVGLPGAPRPTLQTNGLPHEDSSSHMAAHPDSDAHFVSRYYQALCGQSPPCLTLHTLEAAKSPLHAALDESYPPFFTTNDGGAFTAEALAEATLRQQPTGCSMVIEGAGGVLVPLTRQHSMADFAKKLQEKSSSALRALLVARAALGTINHTLLSIEALKNRGIQSISVVFSQTAPMSEAATALAFQSMAFIENYASVLGMLPYVDFSSIIRQANCKGHKIAPKTLDQAIITLSPLLAC